MFNPRPNDVVIGGGKALRNHSGNKLLEVAIKEYITQYNEASKQERSDIISCITDVVHNRVPPGQFVHKDPSTGIFVEVTSFKAVRLMNQFPRFGGRKVNT
jgi:hypothetical protein